MSNKTILVTGGLGYIGSHTIVELLNSEYNVICIDSLINSKKEVQKSINEITNKKFNFHKVDTCNYNDLLDSLSKYSKIDGIIHFAAFKSVNESVRNPLKYYENNILSLLNILKVAMRYNSNLVFSSSCTVYGESKIMPITEANKIASPESPYGNTKIICEEILMDYSKIANIKITSLRYFNPVGAHMSGCLGELPVGIPENLIPLLTQTAIGERDKLIIFGNDYDTHDGTCIRDFIHVSDVALAHISAFNYMKSNHEFYSVFNIGTGYGTSVGEFVSKFIEITGVDLNFEYGQRRKGDIIESWASCAKAEKELNWKSKFSIEDIIISAWNWQKKISSTF